MSILIQQEKVLMPEDIKTYNQELAAREKRQQSLWWKIIRWFVRQP